MEPNKKKILYDQREIIDEELQALLGNYIYYINAQKPMSIWKYLKGLEGLMLILEPYLRLKMAQEKVETFLMIDRFPYDLPPNYRAVVPLMGQLLNLKIILWPTLLQGEIKPIQTFLVIGNKSSYLVLVCLLEGLMNVKEVYLKYKQSRITHYNKYIRYHKQRSPHKVKHKPLSRYKIIPPLKRWLQSNILYNFLKCVKLGYSNYTQYSKTNTFIKFRKETDRLIRETLGPKYKNRASDRNSMKYYFGIKQFKVQNPWLNTQLINDYSQQLKKLQTALENSKRIQIPKNLPDMPRHSRKPKGALMRWLPKQYR